ncbi:MAG: ribonuclease III [Gammaproteobacteria bacterium]|nr:ribonuclease III [Gammaproteobacteria bacterium]MCI0590945.1 ribonuclease III [Gammaproteobacteria bacterium]
MSASIARLCESLGHDFQDRGLLREALTHRSAGNKNNERLEYLGDALLGFIIADALYQRFPNATEGELTRLRATLVRRDTLASLARELDIGSYLKLGGGELKSGGWRRDSILSNALEAMIGAIYLDAGIVVCRERVCRLFEASLASTSLERVAKDPKTELQEYLQARQLPLPSYKVITVEGQAHEKIFTIQCEVAGLNESILAHGPSKQRAEQSAARKVLAQLQAEKEVNRSSRALDKADHSDVG